MSRSRRSYVELRADLLDQVKDMSDIKGVNMSTLFYLWLTQAAQLAYDGNGDLLPRPQKAVLGEGRPTRPVNWLQGADEYNRVRSAILTAGSSVSAVLQAAAQAYLDAGGDVLVMVWPPKSHLREAA